ncbi:MAG: BrnA antitoxin family protein [Deltaproteobacteria bacterium]
MKKEYDFKGGIRGKFYRRKKIQKTLRLDADVLTFYKELAEKEGIPYQTLINLTLRKFAGEGGELVIATKKKTVGE